MIMKASYMYELIRYDYPGVTNNVMVAPDTYAKLASHPNIVGYKM